ncbi:bifunctional pyr operon transcriptional regulator/uracil phosphoribosyltransferase PyrR [Thermoproteota archaeon]
MPDKKTYLILNEDAMRQAIENMAKEIIIKHKRNLHMVVFIGIVSRGLPLAERIKRIILEETGTTIPIGKLDVSLYRDDLTTKGQFITIKASDIPFDLTEKHVILIDDVLFQGRTIRAGLNALLDYGRPRSISLSVLIDRGHRELPIEANFVGQKIETRKTDHIAVNLYESDGEESVILGEK